jgi:GH25 family lysozyme M1 (1,4-beta-N-acetylmuramidase)
VTDVVRGLDVSNYQRDVDWAAVAAAGIRYAWVLATDGSAFVDTYEPADVDGCHANGIAPGGYHFARPAKHSAELEAAWYRAHVPAELELPTALDMEADWLPGTSSNTDWALRWFDATGPAVRVLYTNGDGATVHLDSARLVAAGVELWYAHPGAADFAGAGAWPTAAAVQYGIGPVDGAGNVDLDAMTDETFNRWTKEISMKPAPLVLLDDGRVFACPTDGGAPWHVPNEFMLGILQWDQIVGPTPATPLSADDSAKFLANYDTPAGSPATSLVGTVQIALHPA